MDFKGAGKSLLMTLVYLILYIVFAIVYFIVILWIIKFAAGFVFDDNTLTTNYAVLSAVILTAATLIGGGAVGYFGDDDE